jgi:triosephosphate isomerase
MRRKLVVGNWKMNGSARATRAARRARRRGRSCDVAVCAPFPYLPSRAVAAGQRDRWGAQDCSAHESAPTPARSSAAMLAEFGCRYVIVGHSERRALHGESDQLVADKAKAALAHG